MQIKRHIVLLVFSVFFAIGILFPWNMDVEASNQCYGEGTSTKPTCTGKLAGFQGCTTTNAQDPNWWQVSGAKVERRQSNNCFAKWTRITNISGQSRHTGGSTNYGGTHYNTHAQSIQSGGSNPAKISSGQQVYTPMKGLLGPVLSCGVTSNAPIALPVWSSPPGYLGCRAW